MLRWFHHSTAIALALHNENNGLLTPELAKKVNLMSEGAIDLTVEVASMTLKKMQLEGLITRDRSGEPSAQRGNPPNRIRLTKDGKELAERLLHESPSLKVIDMSGYSAEVAGKDFPLKEGDNFITKPFQASKLIDTIRKKLDAKP